MISYRLKFSSPTQLAQIRIHIFYIPEKMLDIHKNPRIVPAKNRIGSTNSQMLISLVPW